MKRFLVLLPLLALLSGCGSNSNRRVELNENTGQLLPVSALAMDTHKRGYTMTVESIRQDSLNGDAAPAYFTVEGETFDELFQRADELLASRLYLSHAQAVVVSPSIAQNALPALVDCLLGRPDARLTLRIAVARGAAPDEVLRADAVVEGIPGVALAALLDELEAFALTGIPCGTPALAAVRAEVEAAILAPSAAACADIGRQILAALAPELARLCRITDADALTRIAAQLVDYAFSEADRAEAFGDGCDSRLRLHSEAQDAARSGPSADGEDTELDKGDSAGGGSGDNSERYGDMNGSLASQEVKSSGSAGTNGREDRGRSSSVGRSGNHGQSGATATTSDTVSAAQKAASGGPESLREVLGTGWGAHRGFALSAAETDAMLATAAQALTRERTLEQQLHVATPRAARLDAGERQGLADRYAGLTFTETYITPGGGRLPPAFAERAKALHHRLDKLLRQQRERSASQRTGALSQRELWKIPLDAKDVFRRKAPPSKRETAFYLLIDRSGSMGAGIGDGTSKLFTALATAAVLEEALKGIAYTKIVAFDGGTNAVEHCVIKDFDQKEIGSRCIDAMEQIAAGNGNKDGYSIRAAALDLAKRTERRKILMVLSDGLPSGYFSEAEAIDDVRTAVQAARRRGLLVIPIIYTARTDENVDAYRRMYEKSMIFADSVGMLGEFERLLMKLVR